MIEALILTRVSSLVSSRQLLLIPHLLLGLLEALVLFESFFVLRALGLELASVNLSRLRVLVSTRVASPVIVFDLFLLDHGKPRVIIDHALLAILCFLLDSSGIWLSILLIIRGLYRRCEVTEFTQFLLFVVWLEKLAIKLVLEVEV